MLSKTDIINDCKTNFCCSDLKNCLKTCSINTELKTIMVAMITKKKKKNQNHPTPTPLLIPEITPLTRQVSIKEEKFQ